MHPFHRNFDIIIKTPMKVIFLKMNVGGKATDKLDGYIARKYNQVTNLGKLLDPLADKLLISAALILLVSQQMLYAWVGLVIVAREVITNIPIDQILIYIFLVITIYSGFNYIRNNYRFLKIEA